MGNLYDQSWAIIIAANDLNDAKSPLPLLRNPENDAGAVAKILVDKCQFPLDNIFRLVGDKATKDGITDLIDNNLSTKIKKEDRFLIFFAGHAITRPKTVRKEEQGYLVPFDSKWKDRDHPKYNTLLNINNFINETVDVVAARQFLFLIDACFSGIAGKSEAYDSNEDPSPARLRQYAKERQSVQIIAASNRFEQVLDSPKNSNHSMFTQAILDFLEDNDVSDFQEELFISAKKMHRKIKTKVLEDAHVFGDGRSQEPQFIRAEGLDQYGEFVIREIDKSEIIPSKKQYDIKISKMDKLLNEAGLLDTVNNLDIILEINKKIKESDSKAFTTSSILDLLYEKAENDDFIQKKLSEIAKKENLNENQKQDLQKNFCMNILANGMLKGFTKPIIPDSDIFTETHKIGDDGN